MSLNSYSRPGSAALLSCALFALIVQPALGADTAPAPDSARCRTEGLPPTLPDMKALFAAASKLKLAKDQYETSEQHNARTSSLLQDLPGSGRVYATTSIPKTLGSYDADSGKLTLTSTDAEVSLDNFRSDFSPLSGTANPLSGVSTYLGAVITEVSKEGKPYVGQNAFGAKASVHDLNIRKTEIAMREFAPFSSR